MERQAIIDRQKKAAEEEQKKTRKVTKTVKYANDSMGSSDQRLKEDRRMEPRYRNDQIEQ